MSRVQSCHPTTGAMCARSRQRWPRSSTGLYGCGSGRHRRSHSVQRGYPPVLERSTLAEWGSLLIDCLRT
eukprot:2577180-Pleurochrysis_carterae.AAC.1